MTTDASTRRDLLALALDAMLEDAELFGADGILPATLERGDPASGLVVMTGPNACGKSFGCRYLAQTLAGLRKELEGVAKGEFFHIGMRLRTSGNGIFGPKSFVYGDESEDSTGAVSLKAVKGMLRNSRERTSRHVIALDEPEVGLADEYALALGEKIRAFALDLSPLCDALVVVSHSRPFVGKLMDLKPHLVRFGSGTTAEWLSATPAAVSIEDLDSLSERNLKTFRAISRLMRARAEARGQRYED